MRWIALLAGLLVVAVPFTATAKDDAANTTVLKGVVVDEHDHPVGGVTVSASRPVAKGTVKTASDGTFEMPVREYPGGRIYTVLLAETEGRIGSLSVSQSGNEREAVRIVIKPARALMVRVVDADGAPIANAEVSFLASMAPLRSGKTDEQGRWSAQLPSDVKSWSIFARKSGAGFDYEVSEQPGRRETQKPLPDALTLKLTGAAKLTVKVVDHDGKPLAGVGVGPWYLQTPGHAADINLSGASDDWPVTDKSGVAVLDWLPNKIERNLPVMVRTQTHYSQDNATSVDINAGIEEVTIPLLPLEKLSGRVTHADGRPAEGIAVTAWGQGIGHNHGRGGTKTDADGRYEMLVHSEQAYVVAVSDKEWGAPYRADVVVRAGTPVDGIDFSLVPATRVHGTVTVGSDHKPVPETSITAVVDAGRIPKEIEALRPKDDRTYYSVSMHLWSQTDETGEYEFFLGPGEYQLRGPVRTETVELSIPADGSKREIVQDFHMERPETGPFALQVVDRDGKPVADVGVTGAYQTFSARRLWYKPIKTDADGRLTTERSLDPLVLFARNDDRSQAGILRVDAEASSAQIVVQPTAEASGHLLDKQGNDLAEKELRYGVLVYQGEERNSPFTVSFGGAVKTDAEGRFSLEGLVPGETYDVSLKIDSHSSRTIASVTPKDAQAIDLGDIKADPGPFKPYVPPTAAERAADAFAAKPDVPLDERLEHLLAEAHREYTRPLLLIGKPKDPATIDLYKLFYETPAEAEDTEAPSEEDDQRPKSPRELRWEFELAAIDVGRDGVAEELGMELEPQGPPLLIVLNADRSVAARHALVLNDDQQLDREALATFLTKHKLPTRDAEKRLSDAFAKAKAEGKRVFLIASASWCGPCRMLSRFLDPRKDELEKHFVFVKLDVSRDTHGSDIRDKYQGDREGGIPWYAILSADGETLVTSNMKSDDKRLDGQNIGYPGDDAVAVDHFVSMLRTTSPGIDETFLEGLRAVLLLGE